MRRRRPSKEKITELEKVWKRKLLESGFVDIEDGDYLKVYDAYLIDKKYKLGKSNQEYYYLLSQIVSDPETMFDNRCHEFVMKCHADGITNADIVRMLNLKGMKRNRNSVTYIIRRYLVRWNIRKFKPRQLNIKTVV